MARKPDVLIIESSVQEIDEPRRHHLAERYNMIQLHNSRSGCYLYGNRRNTGNWLALDTFRYLTYAQWCAGTDWIASRELGPQGIDPCGKATGVVGLGIIGPEIATKCEATYKMTIYDYGLRRKIGAEQSLVGGATYHDSLADMLPAIDCIVLAAPPYTEATYHMLSNEQFAMTKPAMRVVNIARGKMIDEEALVEALDKKQVVGVGIDVHDNELGVNDRLRNNWKVTLLPHTGVFND